MKKKVNFLWGILLVLFTGLVFTSCSKDSDPAEDIVGSWTVDGAEFDAKIGNKTLLQYYMEDYGLTEPQAQAAVALFNAFMAQQFTGTIDINADNTYEAVLAGEPDSGTWSLSSDNEKLTIDSDSGETIVFDILELSSDRAVLKTTSSIEEDLDGDEVPEDITLTIEMTLTK